MNNVDPIVQPVPDSFIDKLKDVKNTGIVDYRNSSLYGKLLLGSTLALTVYEWGPGNETLTPIVAGAAMESSNGIGGVAITAVVSGGFTYGEQLFSSFLTRKTAVHYPNTAKRSFNLMNNSISTEEEIKFKKFKELPKLKQFLYSFMIGSSFNVAREALVTGSTNEKEMSSVGRRSALISGATVAGIAATADMVDQIVPEGNIVSSVIDLMKTPTPWLTFAGLYISTDYIKSKLKKKKSATNFNP